MQVARDAEIARDAEVARDAGSQGDGVAKVARVAR